MDLETLVRDRYGILEADVTTHDAGMNSRTWWVRAEGGDYVAKWMGPDQRVGSLTAGVAAAALAGRSGVRTGSAVPALGGDRVLLVDGGTLVLLDVVPGTEVGDEHPADLAAIGTTLARVHRATVGHDRTLGLAWHWVDPDAPHLAPYPDVRLAVADAVEEVEALPGLVTGVAHGDPAPEAFLRDGDDVGLIDWAGALTGPLLYDVASASMYVGGLDQAGPLLAAYEAAQGPAAPEFAHLEVMLRFRWAVQADYFAERLSSGDLTGTDAAGNEKGLADARRGLLRRR